MEKRKFYITTPIYYTNAKPHIGHAYTTIACDILARWNRSQGKRTFFLTGTDEHGAKIQKKAAESGKEPQEFVDELVSVFQELWKRLGITNDAFIRTTSTDHIAAVQKVLQTLYNNGSIYKGTYKGLYCVGCEQFKSESELVDGKCPDHGTEPEMMEEECYLMKMSKWQETLINEIRNDKFRIQPEKYKKEILSFLEGQKLEDVSVSRKNLSWGIPLPFDPEHTAYVWIDAFLNYLTGLGWKGDVSDVPDMWPADLEMIGKDILRVHATIWPAILLNLGIKLPKGFFVHGHILSGGKKMSKTLGNVIGIDEMIDKFGVDGTRYLLMSAGTFGEDVDVTMERLTEKYNNDLANGLGNLVSRFLKLAEKAEIDRQSHEAKRLFDPEAIGKMEFGKCLDSIWSRVRDLNKFVDENKPWELAKTDQSAFNGVMQAIHDGIADIAKSLEAFLPETAEKIKKALETGQAEILFQRIR